MNGFEPVSNKQNKSKSIQAEQKNNAETNDDNTFLRRFCIFWC